MYDRKKIRSAQNVTDVSFFCSVEAVGHAHVRDAEFYYHLVKWISRLEAEASVAHTSM